MTGQIHDKVFFNGADYELISVSGEGLFEPSAYGVFPIMLHTACWRGFICSYTVEQFDLLLTSLTIRTLDKKYPPIADISPIDDGYGTMQYHGLHLRVEFLGRLLIGTDFIRKKYVHMGFQRPETYQKLLELTFLAGKLVSAQDRSDEFAKLR